MDGDEEVGSEGKDAEGVGEEAIEKGKGKEVEVEEPVQTPSLEAELECAHARSVMNANIAACYVKLVSCFATVGHECTLIFYVGRMEGSCVCMFRG